jgi:hypothetical protein
MCHERRIWKATQIIGTAILAAFALIMQIKPDDARSNLSAWLSLVTDNVPSSLISPTADKWALAILALAALLLWLGPWIYKRLKKPNKISPPSSPLKSKSKRVGLIELRDYIKSIPGWENIGETLESVDLIKAFREAAHEEVFEVWGRRDDQRLFKSEVILSKIPAIYWEDASLDETRFIGSDDNISLCTYVLEPNKRGTIPAYEDLEVERIPAFEWAQSPHAARYRGDEDKLSPSVQQKQQSKSAVRDTKMHVALAYIETGNWEQDFYEYMATPNANEKGGSYRKVRQAALDGELIVWGTRGEGEPHIKIPQKYWEDWKIEWFSALQKASRTSMSDIGHKGTKIYYDLMVSRTEIEKKWPSPK